MRDAFAPAWFDVAGVPSAQRPALFAQAFRAAVADMEVEVPRQRAFNGRLLWVALPGARLASCFATGARFARRDRRAAHGPGFILLRPVGGSLPVEQAGRALVIKDRQGVLLSLDSPFSYSAPEAVRIDHLLMPADVFGPTGATPGELPLAAADTASLDLLTHYAGAVMQGLIPLRSEQHARLAGAHMRDLVRVMFDGGTAPAPSPAGRLAAVKSAIAPHICRRDLNLDMVARLMGVTPRYIQMLFEADGTTFSAHVLARRLDMARAALEAAPDGPVSAVAYAAGFGDLSYFNRTFRARFGLTPSACRRAGGG